MSTATTLARAEKIARALNKPDQERLRTCSHGGPNFGRDGLLSNLDLIYYERNRFEGGHIVRLTPLGSAVLECLRAKS